MKRMQKWKKRVFIFVAVIVFVRIGYIGIREEVDKEYYTSTVYDLSNASQIQCRDIHERFIGSHDSLNSLELIFDQIAEDKSGRITLCIFKERELIYQTDISLADINNMEWKKIYVNAALERGAEYEITLEASEDCAQIPAVLIVKETAASEIILSAKDDQVLDGNAAINYGYLYSPGIWDCLSVISLWLLFLALILAVLYFYENIVKWLKNVLQYIYTRVRPEVFAAAAEIFACTVIISSSGIDFQESTKIILYAISLAAIVKFDEKKNFLKALTDNGWKKTSVNLLYVYAAFSLVGQRIFIYPLTLKVTIAGMFVFGNAVLWFVPVIQTLLYYLDLAGKHGFDSHTRMKTPVFMFVCTCMLILPAAYNLFVNNPGISSPDTRSCMLMNLHGMYDWHPAFYCMVLRAIQTVWNSTYAVIIVQYFFWMYVLLELLLYLRRKSMNEILLITVAFFTGINAGNFIQINTIWKDIPYTLSLLWALVILAKLSIDKEEYRHKWYVYLELIVSFVGLYGYRKNGVVSFAVIVVMTAFLLRKNIKVWGSIALSVVLIFVIKGPVYHYFEVQDPGKHGMYIGLSQDILGVYYAGGEVSENTLKMINVMTDYNNAQYVYTPTWSDQSYDLEVEADEFIRAYIDTFIKNPVLMLRAVIAREDALWNIYAGQDAVLGCVNYTKTMDGTPSWNDFYQPRVFVSLSDVMAAFTANTADTQWIAAIEWRCGLFVLLGLLSILYLIIEHGFRNYLLIIAPVTGHVLSLLLSTGWSDFRYFWPVNLLNMAVILFVIVILKQEGGCRISDEVMVWN